MTEEFEPDSDFDPRHWPTLWTVPVDDPESVSVRPPAVENPPIFLSFPGSDAPPPIGFTPKLSRDNEAS